MDGNTFVKKKNSQKQAENGKICCQKWGLPTQRGGVLEYVAGGATSKTQPPGLPEHVHAVGRPGMLPQLVQQL